MNDYHIAYTASIPRLIDFLKRTGRPIVGWYDRYVEDKGSLCFPCETECGQKLRYVHTMINCMTEDCMTSEKLKVGCICAAGLESLNYGTDCYEKFYEIIQEIKKAESDLKGQKKRRVQQFKKFCKEVKPCKNNQNYYYRNSDNGETVFINKKNNLYSINFAMARNSYFGGSDHVKTFKNEPIRDLKTASWIAFCGINPITKITERKIPF